MFFAFYLPQHLNKTFLYLGLRQNFFSGCFDPPQISSGNFGQNGGNIGKTSVTCHWVHFHSGSISDVDRHKNPTLTPNFTLSAQSAQFM